MHLNIETPGIVPDGDELSPVVLLYISASWAMLTAVPVAAAELPPLQACWEAIMAVDVSAITRSGDADP
jgi:hypothetical protein